MKDNLSTLSKLGSEGTDYLYDNPSVRILETFENKYPKRDYWVNFIFPEFTSLCPKTGQPDFATISIKYIPDKLCVESKSLKLYFFSYRNCESFMETIVNRILEDLVVKCSPRQMIVVGDFNVRGGTKIVVEAKYAEQEGG